MLKNYGLHPDHYLSAPVLRWNTMLNKTKVALRLISDANMYFFFEESMRGGASFISMICSKANKKYLKSYNSSLFTIFLLALLKNWCLTFLIKKSTCFIMKICKFI